MSSDLRKAYGLISIDYLRKKNRPWKDLIDFIGDDVIKDEIIIDIGGANGRNLTLVEGIHLVNLDLSFDLLQGFVGPKDCNLIQGEVMNLPLRRNCVDTILIIAVLHHLKTEENRQKGSLELSRVFSNGKIILSVWRKWRQEVRDRIIPKIKLKLDHWDEYNVELPWKDSQGNITAKRFYHYFTFQELTGILRSANLQINKFERSGGRHKDANFFCFSSSTNTTGKSGSRNPRTAGHPCTSRCRFFGGQ